MIPFARPSDFSPGIVALSSDFIDWPYLAKIHEKLPASFAAPIWKTYGKKREIAGQQAANIWAGQVSEKVTMRGVSLASSDDEICNAAAEYAREVRGLLADAAGPATPESIAGRLADYCDKRGVMPPEAKTLAGMIGRLTESAWWRRALRRCIARQVEAQAIGLGLVHRRAGLYASEEAVQRHAEQQARNRRALEATEATNEEGLTMTLAELSAVSVSNPRIRRGELMTRIAGFESFAKAAGHVGMFYTATAPSRWHAVMAKSGERNPHYDEKTTPKECAGYLGKTFAKARAWLHRRGIHIYGFRVAEPHHDGTPHWHMLFFMVAEVVESVTYCFRKYFSEADAHELKTEKAAKARFEAVKIDWKRGSAAGYISKYIAKNIDGSKNDLSSIGQAHDETEEGVFEVGEADKTAPRVLAWASTWGIRQFQQIGGPGVTVWRELRRLREMDHQGDLFDTWSAADTGNWHEFTERQGGVDCKRADRPVQLWKEAEEGKRNRYGEEAGAEIKGVRMGDEVTITRLHTWEIKRKAPGLLSGKSGKPAPVRPITADQTPGALPLTLGAERPWSPVNNCTRPEKDADGFTVGEFAGQDAPPELPAAMQEKIKAAQVAAVLAGITAKRKRGAFGQFPRLNFSNRPGGQKHATSNC